MASWHPEDRDLAFNASPSPALPVISCHSPHQPHTPAAAALLTSPQAQWLQVAKPLHVSLCLKARLALSQCLTQEEKVSLAPLRLITRTPGSATTILDLGGQGAPLHSEAQQ